MLELEDLPLEVVENIADQLVPNSLCALRSTSKRYEVASFKALVTRIQSLRFAIAPWSLPTLLQIAQHNTIGSKIETVRLSQCLLDRNGWIEEVAISLDGVVNDSVAHHHITGRLAVAERAFRDYYHPQQEFLKEGARAMLSEIFNLLPNLKTVAFGEWEVDDVLDDNENYFNKDLKVSVHGLPAEAAQVFGETDSASINSFKEINVVLRAIAETQKPIERFVARSYSFVEDFVDLSHVIRISAPLSNGLSVAFKHLRTLHLSVGEEEMYEPDEDYDDEEEVAPWGSDEINRWLADFLSLTPNLEELTLSLCHCEDGASVFQRISRMHLPLLKKFELHFAFVSEQDLKTFLVAHATSLQAITLRYCGLTDSIWRSFLHKTFDSDTTFKATVTLARLNEFGVDSGHGSIVFDTDKLHECCDLGSHCWGKVKHLDCEHVRNRCPAHAIRNVAMSIVDRRGLQYKLEAERQDRRWREYLAQIGESPDPGEIEGGLEDGDGGEGPEGQQEIWVL